MASVDPVNPAGAEVFVPALESLLSTARDELHAGPAPTALRRIADVDALDAQMLARLGRRLARAAARTLVLELHQARRRGELAGSTSRERFTDFLRRMAMGGLAEVLTRYPVLSGILAQERRCCLDAHRELLARFAVDHEVLVRPAPAGEPGDRLGGLLGPDPGRLVAADPSGDSHGGGRAVSVLRFTGGGRLVYRPRPVELYEHFAMFVTWLNARVPGLDLRTVRVLRRDRYGWLEFVPAQPCPDQVAVHRFYCRYGALLALLYVLGATDVHYENLVACADQPVVIDIETLFQPKEAVMPFGARDPALTALAGSVLATALLPALLRGEDGTVDLSGLGGAAWSPLPYPSAGWADAGTDTMRLVRVPGTTGEAFNRPTLLGQPVDPDQHVGDLVRGFRAAYEVICDNRVEFIGLLRSCGQDEIRLIPRATMLYSGLLDESTHPDVLRTAADRDALFEILAEGSAPGSTHSALVPAERAALWAGDVPYFGCRPSSREIWTSDGTPVPVLLAESPLAAVEASVHGLGEEDRLRQEWLMIAAISSRHAEVCHRMPPRTGGRRRSVAPFGPDRALAAAQRIAGTIAATAYRRDGRANWLGIEPVGDRDWTVYAMGGGLPHGYCGVALFLAQLAALTQSPSHRALAADALAGIPPLLGVFADDPAAAEVVGCGVDGIGGISYTLARLARLLDDPEPLSWLDVLLEVAGSIAVDDTAGVADGLAGGLAAMVASSAETGSAAAAALAARYADRLTALVAAGKLPDRRGTGFARGTAGVTWALARFARSGRDPVADQHLAAARSIHAGEPVDQSRGWCEGRAGWLLGAHELAAEAATGRRDPQAGKGGAAGLFSGAPSRDLSLCHGELGVLDVAVTIGTSPDEVAPVAGLALAAVEHGDPGCGTPAAVPTPGLFLGLSGIGYGLLRLGFPDRVPSVLCLGVDHKQLDLNGA